MVLIYLCYNVNVIDLDVLMASPPTSPPRHALQGASHMTGGVLRGRAQGIM